MAPIRVKWDPEILAAGFRPTSIFDEVEATNMTAPVNMTASPASEGLETLVGEVMRQVADLATSSTTTTTTTAPVDVAGMQSTAAAAHPARNVTGVINTLMRDAVDRVVALVVNTTVPPTTTPLSITPVAPSWSPTTPTTTIKRAVERAAATPEIALEHVSIIYTC